MAHSAATPCGQRLRLFLGAHLAPGGRGRSDVAVGGHGLAEPRRLRFATGRRKDCWKRNCVAVGLSSGFLEPLESTSIHLIQSAITKLITLFPSHKNSDGLRREFNVLMEEEFVTVRDFLILHYKVNQRAGSFWSQVRDMPIPDRLAAKIALFEDTGRIVRRDHDIFSESSWLAVAVGQGLTPHGRHPISDVISHDANLGRLSAIETASGARPTPCRRTKMFWRRR